MTEIFDQGSRVGMVGFAILLSLGAIWTIYRFRQERRREEVHFDPEPPSVFEGLPRLSDEELRRALQGLPVEELAIALIGASAAIREKVLANLTEERASQCRTCLDRAHSGVGEVEAARQTVEAAICPRDRDVV